MDKKIALVILAAGASSRMGTPKQLLPWGSQTLLGHAISEAQASLASDVFVVLGSSAAMISSTINLQDTPILIHENWAEGLGSSISFAVSQLLALQTIQYDGILLTLADQPFITSAFYNTLITQFKSGIPAIVATSYGNWAGTPALFSSSMYQELLKLKGDKGAKNIIMENTLRLEVIEGRDKILDIDTPEVYRKWKPENTSEK